MISAWWLLLMLPVALLGVAMAIVAAWVTFESLGEWRGQRGNPGIVRYVPASAPDATGWVLCSERLPEPGSAVLAIDGTGILVAEWDGATWGDAENATHWRPLPPDPTAYDDEARAEKED